MKYDLFHVRNPGSILINFCRTILQVGLHQDKPALSKIMAISFLCGWRSYAANKRVDKSLAFCSWNISFTMYECTASHRKYWARVKTKRSVSPLGSNLFL